MPDAAERLRAADSPAPRHLWGIRPIEHGGGTVDNGCMTTGSIRTLVPVEARSAAQHLPVTQWSVDIMISLFRGPATELPRRASTVQHVVTVAIERER